MNNYIENSIRWGASLHITEAAKEKLKCYVPKGCPFKGYTLFDLLCDWIKQYSWKIPCGEMSIIDFVKMLQAENYEKANAYGGAIKVLIEES